MGMSTIRPAPIPGAVTVRRALLSVSDKTGLVALRPGPARSRRHAALDRRDCQGSGRGGPAGRQRRPTSRRSPRCSTAGSRRCTRRCTAASWRAGTCRTIWSAIGAHGIQPIDLVVVNLYPFAKAAADPATGFDALIEEIDIGGPSMVRAAAKNFRDVLIVVDPADYPRVLEDLAAPGGSSAGLPLRAVAPAFAHTAAYDADHR